MNGKLVLILGGTIDHVELIKQLQLLKYYVVLLDYFENPAAAAQANLHLTVSTRDLMAIEQVIIDYKPQYILSACVESSLHTLFQLNAQFNYKLLFTAEQYNVISNKETMKKWFKQHAFSSASFEIINADAPINTVSLKLPLVLKPLHGNSSKGISLITKEEAWSSAIKKVLEFTQTDSILVEEYITGSELTVDVAFIDGQAQVLMISEIIKKEAFSATIVQNIYNREVEEKWHCAIHELVTEIGKKLDLRNSLMLLQCIVNEEGIYILEFSLRIGGGNKHHLIKKIKNINIIEWYIQLILNGKVDYDASMHQLMPQYNFGIIDYIYPDMPGKITNLEIKEDRSETTTVFAYKKEGDVLPSTENSSNRIAGILHCNNNYAVLQQEVQRQRDYINFSIDSMFLI
jgi:phosphoribosylamine-glycine ligase